MTSQSLVMPAPPEVYQTRRARLAAGLSHPLVLFSGMARPRNLPAMTYPFRAGSHYLYFGGPSIEGAALILEPGSDGRNGCTLVRSTHGFESSVWVGPPLSDEEIAQAAGLTMSSLIEPSALQHSLAGRKAAFIAPPCAATEKLAATLQLEAAAADVRSLIVDIRLIMDEHELRQLRVAAAAGVEAHLQAMKATKPGSTEAAVAGALIGSLVRSGCDVSFSPIVTVRGEILHCEGFPNALQAGQLLLVDAGAEVSSGYASDITRTYPVTGRFDTMQRQLYDTVLRAEHEAMAACVPGRRYRDVHDVAARAICRGLVEAELLRGDPEELFARRAHTLFFTHGVGHLLGLDVHDMEDLGDLAGYAAGRTRRPEFGNKYLRLDRDLEPGMVVTIEPGIYLVPEVWANEELVGPFADVVNRRAVDDLLKARFGGIRIEDDVHVREEKSGGPEILTADLPTDPDAVTALVGKD